MGDNEGDDAWIPAPPDGVDARIWRILHHVANMESTWAVAVLYDGAEQDAQGAIDALLQAAKP